VHIYIKIKFGFNLERDKIVQFFTKIDTKLKQK